MKASRRSSRCWCHTDSRMLKIRATRTKSSCRFTIRINCESPMSSAEAPSSEPRLIAGGIAVDDRGAVRFVNDFDFAGVKRFYWVTNHRSGLVRAWHAHRRETKHVTVLRGA